MDCEQNCEICSGCNTHGSCGGLAAGDGEILAQLATFGHEFSRKLLASNSHLGCVGSCLRSVLFGKFLRIIPNIPHWIDRDRFIVGDEKIPSLCPWLYLAGFHVQLGDMIAGGTSENLDFQSFGIERSVKSPIAKAIEVAISHKNMTTALRQSGIHCLGKVLGLVGNISPMDESLQDAINEKLNNLILIFEVNAADNSACIPISELRAIGFHIEEIVEGDTHVIFEKLIHARINSQRQPQVIIIRDHSEIASPNKNIAGEDFFVPDAIHSHFAILNMRKNSDYENWQYRFECAVDFHPEILQFVEELRAH